MMQTRLLIKENRRVWGACRKFAYLNGITDAVVFLSVGYIAFSVTGRSEFLRISDMYGLIVDMRV